MDTVKPALTRHQWALREVRRGPLRMLRWDEVGRELYIDMQANGFNQVRIAGDDMHPLAALLLDRQPFGFTWADVDALREIGGRPMTHEALNTECTCRPIPVTQQELTGGEFGYHEAECARSVAVRSLPFQTYAWAGSLADRLEALLPPRETVDVAEPK